MIKRMPGGYLRDFVKEQMGFSDTFFPFEKSYNLANKDAEVSGSNFLKKENGDFKIQPGVVVYMHDFIVELYSPFTSEERIHSLKLYLNHLSLRMVYGAKTSYRLVFDPLNISGEKNNYTLLARASILESDNICISSDLGFSYFLQIGRTGEYFDEKFKVELINDNNKMEHDDQIHCRGIIRATVARPIC